MTVLVHTIKANATLKPKPIAVILGTYINPTGLRRRRETWHDLKHHRHREFATKMTPKKKETVRLVGPR